MELATKADIDRLDKRIDDLAAQMRIVHNEIHKTSRLHMMFTIGAMTALTGIFTVIVGLIA